MYGLKKIIISLFLAYLRLSAQIQLVKIKPKIIALTGSAGKTSLRNAVFSVLKDHFKVKKSHKANSETGLPLDILGLHPSNYSLADWLRLSLLIPWQLLTNWEKYDYYIAELGIDDPLWPKNMEYLLTFIHPDIGIFLNAGLVHAWQFEKIIPPHKTFASGKEKEAFLLQAIAQEKGKIITFLSKEKIALVNLDDPLVMEQAKKSKAMIYGFGRSINKCHKYTNKQINDKFQINKWLRIIKYQVNNRGTEFIYQWQGKKINLKLAYLLPQYYSSTLAGAILTGLVCGLTIKQASESLKRNFVLPAGRMSVFKGVKNTILLDSSYNASKEAMLGALDLLVQIGLKRKKIVVFGDMREQGQEARGEHEAVAKKILKVADEVILVGDETEKYILTIISSKIPTKHFRNSWPIGKWLEKRLKGKEIILFKGSQNKIFLEIAIEQLLADKNDVNKLCRRGRFWDSQRKAVV